MPKIHHSLSASEQEQLKSTANRIVESGKGILAADEINATMDKRFSVIGVENCAKNRQVYRTMLFYAGDSGHQLNQYISGIILNHETFYQMDDNGISLSKVIASKGILPGIKGLDGLNERCAEYAKKGAKFAKWRCVYKIQDGIPSLLALKENANVLARYASICQQHGLVPIVEPEVLRDGSHDLWTNQKVTEQVLSYVYKALMDHHVYLEGTLLKPNMVTAGQSCTKTYSAAEIAKATVTTLQRAVPCAVPGIVFLSGGQSEEEATLNLNAMNQMNTKKPWKLSFSFARALQASALQAWGGESENIKKAQDCLLNRAEVNSLATLGKYMAESRVSEISKTTNFVPQHVY